MPQNSTELLGPMPPLTVLGNPKTSGVNGPAIPIPISTLQGLSGLVKNGITSNATGLLGSVPANAFLLRLLLRNTTANAVNVTLGITSGGSDVGPNPGAAPWTVPANGTLTADIGGFLKGWFSATATQAIYLASSSWGGASINAKLDFEVGP